MKMMKNRHIKKQKHRHKQKSYIASTYKQGTTTERPRTKKQNLGVDFITTHSD